MRKILLLTFLFWSLLSFGDEFSPLKYEYKSPEFSCLIDDFELEHDLDFFEGFRGCVRTGTEEADFKNERVKIRKDPTEFKRIQLNVAEQELESILKEYPVHVLKSNGQIRKKIACYLSMLDNVPKELNDYRKNIILNSRFDKIKDLEILPESFLSRITVGTQFNMNSEEELWAKYKEYNEQLKSQDPKKYNDLGFRLLKDYVEVKKRSKNIPTIKNEKLFIEFIIKNKDNGYREGLFNVAEEERFFPLIKDHIFIKNKYSVSDDDYIVLEKLFDSSNVSTESKCSAVRYLLVKLNESVIARSEKGKKFVTYLKNKDLKCPFDYKVGLDEVDPKNNAFYKKWCYQKDTKNCLFAIRNEPGNIYQECNRNSDCIKSKIGNCGYFYSNKEISKDLLSLFEYWCSDKNGNAYYFTRNDDVPVCVQQNCTTLGGR